MSDLISRQAAIDAFMNATSDGDKFEWCKWVLNQLPSAQPERKTGRWININDGKWNTIRVYKCSACGEIDNRVYETDNYCPNCGAKMEV